MISPRLALWEVAAILLLLVIGETESDAKVLEPSQFLYSMEDVDLLSTEKLFRRQDECLSSTRETLLLLCRLIYIGIIVHYNVSNETFQTSYCSLNTTFTLSSLQSRINNKRIWFTKNKMSADTNKMTLKRHRMTSKRQQSKKT